MISNLALLAPTVDSETAQEYGLSAVNRLPIHLHHHVYWIVPLLVVGVALLVLWAMSSTDHRGPQL
ncbi:MAG: hypothetical protein JOZ10_03015 [Acidobacteria bacterium]|nr:hypothetical protein [Acidobacteriota bacterium]MBV9144666.1 hypothetical protein [Acidobacteriota bacterium]